MPRTYVHEQLPEELEWAENASDRCDPGAKVNHQIVIDLTAQARIHFGAGFIPHEQNRNTAGFSTKGPRQMFYGILIDESSRAVTRRDDLELKTTVFHPRDVAASDEEVPAGIPTRPSTVRLCH